MSDASLGRLVNLSAPNLLSLCVDTVPNREFAGRLYHRFSSGPIPIAGSGPFFYAADALFDRIGYPQASTRFRDFVSAPAAPAVSDQAPPMLMDLETLLSQRGRLATFLIHVQQRQNASWQGKVTWVEQGKSLSFSSALDLLKLLDNALCFRDRTAGQ